MQAPPGDGVMSQGLYATLVLTLSPEPGPTGPGPLAAPHQLHVPLTEPPEVGSLKTPKTVLPVIEFLWAATVSLTEFAATFTPYALLLSVLPVTVTLEFNPTPKK